MIASVLTSDLGQRGLLQAHAQGRDWQDDGETGLDQRNSSAASRKRRESHHRQPRSALPSWGGVIDLIASDAISRQIAKDLFGNRLYRSPVTLLDRRRTPNGTGQQTPVAIEGPRV